MFTCSAGLSTTQLPAARAGATLSRGGVKRADQAPHQDPGGPNSRQAGWEWGIGDGRGKNRLAGSAGKATAAAKAGWLGGRCWHACTSRSTRAAATRHPSSRNQAQADNCRLTSRQAAGQEWKGQGTAGRAQGQAGFSIRCAARGM